LIFLGSSLYQDKEEQKQQDCVAVKEIHSSQTDDSQRNNPTALTVN